MLSPESVSPEVLAIEAAIPAGRVGQPEEIAATAVFLAWDAASFYYGQMLAPNGGVHMGEATDAEMA